MARSIDPETDWEKIGKMADENATRNEIALVYGVTAPAISYVLKKMGKTAASGREGRKPREYTVAKAILASPSRTLRMEAKRRGLVESTAHIKLEKKLPAPAGARGRPKKEESRDEKPWEYGSIYDPELGRMITQAELFKSVAEGAGKSRGKREARAGRKKRRTSLAGRKKASPKGRGEVPEAAPGSGTGQPEGEGQQKYATLIKRETIEAATTVPEQAPSEGETQAEARAEPELVVPAFLKEEHDERGGRPRISHETIVVGGQGRGKYREIAVQRISGGVRPVRGTVARESTNTALLVQKDLIKEVERLAELAGHLTDAVKSAPTPRHYYRQEVGSRCREVHKTLAEIESSLLKL